MLHGKKRIMERLVVTLCAFLQQLRACSGTAFLHVHCTRAAACSRVVGSIANWRRRVDLLGPETEFIACQYLLDALQQRGSTRTFRAAEVGESSAMISVPSPAATDSLLATWGSDVASSSSPSLCPDPCASVSTELGPSSDGPPSAVLKASSPFSGDPSAQVLTHHGFAAWAFAKTWSK